MLNYFPCIFSIIAAGRRGSLFCVRVRRTATGEKKPSQGAIVHTGTAPSGCIGAPVMSASTDAKYRTLIGNRCLTYRSLGLGDSSRCCTTFGESKCLHRSLM